MAQQPRRSRTTFLWGVLSGIILALLIVLDRLVLAGQLRHAGLDASLVAVLLSRAVLYILGLALFFLAGLFAARRSGAVESGVFAGLLAGGLAGLTNLVFAVLAAGAARRRLPRVATARHALPALHAAAAAGISSGVVAFVVVSLVGAGAGALGGLAGRRVGGRGQPFHGGGGPSTFGYPPGAPQAPASGYGSPMPPTEYIPATPPPPGYTPPMPPGYVPGNDDPTIQTGAP